MENKTKVTEAKVAKVRAKTASFNAEQIREMGKNEKLADKVAELIEDSEGNLTGVIAFQVARALMKQLVIEA